MKTHVEFRSSNFPAYPGEEEEINPGIWGKRLAEFLAAALKMRGVVADEPVAEDWGWMIPIKNDGFPLWIGCANSGDHPDSFLCFVEPARPFVRRLFKKIPTETKVSAVTQALNDVLAAEPAIRSIRWWTKDEFNDPGTEHGIEDGG